MKSKLLLVTLLKAFGSRNILKYETDEKKKKRERGNIIGYSLIYVMIAFYAVIMAIGFGMSGTPESIPAMMVAIVSAIGFIFCLIKVNGYLYIFSGYDMLMALPFSVEEIVSVKFLQMYLKDLPMTLSISIAMMIGYMVFGKGSPLTVILWIVLTAALLLIVQLLATIIATLFVKISAKTKLKQIVQAIFIIAFTVICVFSRFIFEDIFKNDKVEDALQTVDAGVQTMGSFFLPVKWFEKAIVENSISSILLLLGTAILMFAIVFKTISLIYRRLNTDLLAGNAGKANKKIKNDVRNVKHTFVFCEFRRFMNSTNYLINAGLGVVFGLIFMGAFLFLDVDVVVSKLVNGAEISKEVLLPLIPIVLYYFTGMVSSTSMSPSLEGKNSWIIDSLPVCKQDVYKGKAIFNLYLFLPIQIISSVCIGLRCGAGVKEILSFIACGVAMCMFSTFFGLTCGIRHIKLEWENDMEVIKNSAGVGVYVLVNMVLTMIATVGAIFIGISKGAAFTNFALAIIYGILAFIFYKWSMKLAKA